MENIDSPTEHTPATNPDSPKPGPVSNSTETQSLQATLQSITDQALRFLSTASNETIGACLVGLGATTYLVLGRVGLVLMGVVGGVVLHATWEGSLNDTPKDSVAKAAEEKRRKDLALDVVKRALSWRSRKHAFNRHDYNDNDNDVDDDYDNDHMSEKIELFSNTTHLDFEDYPPKTASALKDVTDAIIRDYIQWWYTPVLPGELNFPSSCRQSLTAFILSASNHLSRKRPADVFLEFLTHSSSILVVFLNELATAINLSPDTSTQEAVELYLDTKPNSNLSYVVDTEHQTRKLDLVADDMLEAFLEHKALNCEPIRTFLREIISKLVLEYTVQYCSRAEFINEWIVYLLDDVDPTSQAAAAAAGNAPNTPTIGPQDSNNSNSTTLPPVPEDSPEQRRHKRVVSKAQEAMDEAMKEAARLSKMIADEEASKAKDKDKDKDSQSYSGLASSINTDSDSTTNDIHTPASSQGELPSQNDSINQLPPTLPIRPSIDTSMTKQSFTNFDQILPKEKPTALLDDPERGTESISTTPMAAPEPIPEFDTRSESKSESSQITSPKPTLTLQNANIIIMDDSSPSDRSAIRQKPITEYLIQCEPTKSNYPGWMVVRKLNDFETLHQVLVRIARISDAKKFAESHPNLPNWRGTTKAKFREELERYLIDAVQHRSLADSEGMKRFLEKDFGFPKVQTKSNSFGLGAIENVGKGVFDVLSQAPKGVVGGGKAVIGGVQGVLGAAARGPKKQSISISSTTPTTLNGAVTSPSSLPFSRSSTSISLNRDSLSSPNSHANSPARKSNDSILRPSPTTIVDTQPGLVPQMERRPSNISEPEAKPKVAPSWASESTPVLGGDQILTLPPPPSAIPDDYGDRTYTSPSSSRQSLDLPSIRGTISPASISVNDLRTTVIPEETLSISRPKSPSKSPNKLRPPKPKAPLSERETQVAIELALACITELYKLSSAWSVRLAFLNAAKSILLRPGNAQLDSIRQLLQATLLDTHTSDTGLATLLALLRANSLPTASERAAWPAPRSPEAREELRRRARALLVERGMPSQLNSVMGQAASGEALGRVFDAVQVGRVARGLVFGVALQGLRAMML